MDGLDRTLRRCVVAFCSSLLGLSLASPAKSGELIERTRSAWQAREARHTSFVADWTEMVTTFAGMEGRDNAGNPFPKADVVHPVRFHMACDGKKARLNRSGVEYSIDFNDYIEKNFTRVFDGVERKEVFQSKSLGGRPGGFLNDIRLFDIGDWRIQPFVLAFRPATIGMGAPDLTLWRETGRRETVNGIDCDILEWDRGPGVLERLAIAHGSDSRALRRSTFVHGQLFDELTIDWDESPEHGFVCRGSTRVRRLEDGRPQKTYVVADLRLTVNTPVDASEFDYHFSPGTVVTHERTQAIANVRKDGSYRSILPGEMVSGQTYDELMESDPPPEAGEFVPGTGRSWSQTVTLFLVAAGIVLLVWWSRKRLQAAG